jgi:hypothetical protein
MSHARAATGGIQGSGTARALPYRFSDWESAEIALRQREDRTWLEILFTAPLKRPFPARQISGIQK